MPFATYHVMVGLGMLFIGLTLLGLFFLWRGTLFEKRWLLWVFVFAVAGPYVANEFGWVAAEVGRQPWVVQDLLRTSDAVSKSVPAAQMLASIAMFGLIYVLLFAVFVFVLNDKIQHGPEEETAGPSGTTGEGLLAAAARLQDHRGVSLTGTGGGPSDEDEKE